MRLLLHTLMISLTRTLEEGFAFLLKPIKLAAACKAFAGNLKGHIKQPGTVGLNTWYGPLLKRMNSRLTQLPPPSLISITGVGKTVANYPLPGFECRQDD